MRSLLDIILKFGLTSIACEWWRSRGRRWSRWGGCIHNYDRKNVFEKWWDRLRKKNRSKRTRDRNGRLLLPINGLRLFLNWTESRYRRGEVYISYLRHLLRNNYKGNNVPEERLVESSRWDDLATTHSDSCKAIHGLEREVQMVASVLHTTVEKVLAVCSHKLLLYCSLLFHGSISW